MKAYRYLVRRRWLQLAITGVGATVLAIFAYAETTSHIDSYAACLEAGNPVLDTDPPICRDGPNNFTGTPRPEATPGAELQSVDFELLVDADTAGPNPPREQLHIATQSDWQAYWRHVHAGRTTLPPLLPVDFAASDVVAVNLGRQLTGGYGLKITTITTGPAGTTVNVTETSPGQRCLVTQAATNRYMIVRTAKLQEPVVFRTTKAVHECP